MTRHTESFSDHAISDSALSDHGFAETVFAGPAEGLRFVVLSGRHAGASLDLRLPLLEPLSIGSHLACSLVLADNGLASTHALVFERDGVLWLACVPGAGNIRVDERPIGEAPVRLTRGMGFELAEVRFRVEGEALPDDSVAADGRHAPAPRKKKKSGMPRVFASALCVLCGALLLALSLGTSTPARSKSVAHAAVDRSPGGLALAGSSAAEAALDAAAQQVDRYIGDPGVQALPKYPGRIEVKGTARSANTRLQIEKIGRVMPPGVELSSSVSYPKEEALTGTAALRSEPLSKLARKVLQVAASERVPYIEIEGGERVFEGGQLNGFELLKIGPGEIVVRRDGHLQSFKVE